MNQLRFQARPIGTPEEHVNYDFDSTLLPSGTVLPGHRSNMNSVSNGMVNTATSVRIGQSPNMLRTIDKQMQMSGFVVPDHMVNPGFQDSVDGMNMPSRAVTANLNMQKAQDIRHKSNLQAYRSTRRYVAQADPYPPRVPVKAVKSKCTAGAPAYTPGNNAVMGA